MLVLDEPTAVLPHEEVERLFEVVAEVRRRGMSVLYVSHRMDEIFQLADRVTVLRGGRRVGTYESARSMRGPSPGRWSATTSTPTSGRAWSTRSTSP